MNKKGIIFTMDALIALTIFVAVVFITYSTFTPDRSINIQTSSIYSTGDNFIRALDKSEKLSEAFKTGDYSELEELISNFQYDATLRFYERGYDGDLTLIQTINDKEYEDSIIIRKFLVLSTQGVDTSTSDCNYLEIGVTCIDEKDNSLEELKSVEADASGTIKEDFQTFFFYDLTPACNDSLDENVPPDFILNVTSAPGSLPNGWATEPSYIYINYLTTPPSEYETYWDIVFDDGGCDIWRGTFNFNLTIDPLEIDNSDIGQHEINMTIDIYDDENVCIISNYHWMCTTLDNFHLLRYGFVEFEVGTQ